MLRHGQEHYVSEKRKKEERNTASGEHSQALGLVSASREPRGARLMSPLGVHIFVSFDKDILQGDCSSSLIRVSSPGPWLF